jgi:hypothetical protein
MNIINIEKAIATLVKNAGVVGSNYFSANPLLLLIKVFVDLNKLERYS